MTNPTSNYGWQMPTSTDLVTDLPADFEVFGQAVDTSLAQLKGGTTGQVLSKTSATDMAFTWVAQDDSNAIQNAIVDAKGDLIAASAADTPARLAVGANDTVLTADSTAATGLKWSAPAAANGPAFFGYRGTSNQTISQNVITKISYNAEVFDTDSCFNISTGRFTPTKAGKYQVNVNLGLSMNGSGRALCKIYKNGNAFINLNDFGTSNNDFYTSGSSLIDMNGTTDYLEVYAMGSNTTNTIAASSGASSEQYNVFSGTWVRS